MNSDKTGGAWEAVTLARVVRAHGIRGEVACEILTDFPERLLQLREVWLAAPSTAGKPRKVAVVRCRLTGGRPRQALIQFEGVATRDDAERLRGQEVQVPLAERVALSAGQYFVTDLIGCEVFEISDVTVGAQHLSRAESRDAVPLPHDTHVRAPSTLLLGSVRDVQTPGEKTRGTPVLVVDTPRGELLIPLAEDICTRIDPRARRIEVRLPEGLLDLNP